jgi:hypothetical protein
MADLIEQADLESYLDAAGLTLTAAQTALLPTLAASASRAIRRWCRRHFNRRTAIDEVYTAERGAELLLKEFPVSGISRLATSPTCVLAITNTASANQRATVTLTTTGDADAGLVVTGLSLWRIASGVAATDTVLFAGNLTVQAVADAVNALGNGWSATVTSGYGLWPSADLRAVQGALPAKDQDAELLIHVEDLAFELETETGTVWLASAPGVSDAFRSRSWGPGYGDDPDDLAIRPTPQGIRVVYDAGFATVPEDVQQACAEAVKAALDRLQADSTLTSERGAQYAYTLRDNDLIAWLPAAVRQGLAVYRSVRL